MIGLWNAYSLQKRRSRQFCRQRCGRHLFDFGVKSSATMHGISLVSSVLATRTPVCPLPSPSSLLKGRTAESPRGRARARHPRTALSPLLPPPFFVSPLQNVHALLSPLFSLLPTFRVFRGYISYRLAEQGVRESHPATGCTHSHKIRRLFYQYRYSICLKGYSSGKFRLAVILDDQQPTNQEIPTLRILLPLI